METGCGLLLIVATVAAAWWLVRIISTKSMREKEWEVRFETLQSQLASLKESVQRLEAGSGVATSSEAGSETATVESPSLSTPALDPFTAATTPPLHEDEGVIAASSKQARALPASSTPLQVSSQSPGPAARSEHPGSEQAGSEQTGPEPPPVLPEVTGEPPVQPPASDTFGVPDDEPSELDPSEPPRPSIDWEQWVGVRGLAVLAGVVAAVAGIYFVRYSIEEGWIPPTVRVALLMLAGIGSIGFGEHLRKRNYPFPASALQGAGIVMLYAAVWSARTLYGLIGSGTAAAILALVTAAGGVLAVRHGSLVIALLGLLGGFATPLLISSGSDNVVGLFGYLLLLNTGVALVGRRGHWPILSALSLAATVLYQGAWIFTRMEGRISIGLLILGVFALFFLWDAERSRTGDTDGTDGTDKDEQTHPAFTLGMTLGALFSPFVFAVYFTIQADLGERLLPMGALLLMLNASAAWIARRRDLPVLALGTVAATLGVLAVWPFAQELELRGSLEVTAGLLLLATLHQVAAVFLGSREDSLRWRLPQLVAALFGLGLVTLLHAVQWAERGPSGWLVVGAVAMAGLLLWQSRQWFLSPEDPSPHNQEDGNATETGPSTHDAPTNYSLAQERRTLPRLSWLPAGGASIGVGLFLLVSFFLRRVEVGSAGLFKPPWLIVALLLFAVVLQVLAVHRAGLVQSLSSAVAGVVGTAQPSRAASWRSFEWVLALFPIIGFASLLLAREKVPFSPTENPALWPIALAAILLSSFLLLTATRLGDGKLMAVALLGTAIVQTFHAEQWQTTPWLGLLLVTITIALFVLWPLVFSSRSAVPATSPENTEGPPASVSGGWPLATWRTAALAPIALAPAFHYFFIETLGKKTSPVAMLVLAAASVLALRAATAKGSNTHRTSIQAWFGGVTLVFIAIAVPLQLDKEWITVGWALLTVGIAALWRRVDHAGLKLFALGLASAVLARLLLNPEVFNYHTPRSPFGYPVLGWLLYTYLLPALALLAAARIFERDEPARLRKWEPFYHRSENSRADSHVPWVAGTLAAFGVVIAFAWINLTIFDAFAQGDKLRLALDRAPARDLSLSVAWSVYALVLLGFGVARRSKTLRWTSLLMIFATIAKVFLYDLGELEDLYRVASLVGLAFSLLAVSMLYQRFVFGSSNNATGNPSPKEGPSTQDDPTLEE